MPVQMPSNTDGREFIRGYSEVPLSPHGHEQALQLGRKLRDKVDTIYTSPLGRAKDTAASIMANNPHANVNVMKDLMPWKLGGDEGKPVEDVLPDMLDRIKNRPDDPSTKGKGPISTAEGESFNDFKHRSLNAVKTILHNHQPGENTVVATHYRNIRAIHSWLAKGAPADNEVDTQQMSQKGDSDPGDMFYLHPGSKQLVKVDDIQDPGVYFVRHGATTWNKEDKSGAPAGGSSGS